MLKLVVWRECVRSKRRGPTKLGVCEDWWILWFQSWSFSFDIEFELYFKNASLFHPKQGYNSEVGFLSTPPPLWTHLPFPLLICYHPLVLEIWLLTIQMGLLLPQKRGGHCCIIHCTNIITQSWNNFYLIHIWFHFCNELFNHNAPCPGSPWLCIHKQYFSHLGNQTHEVVLN